MDAGGEKKPEDFYSVLGLRKECTAAELRMAYKKLAMRWHPDRCLASGNSKHIEEAKKKFQAIQQAYSVLSDDNKRFLYDVGVCVDDDDDDSGMGDFLNEMAAMMSENECNGNRNESFEDLQGLFMEMFQSDVESFASSSQPISNHSPCFSWSESSSTTNKRNLSEMDSTGKSHGNASGFSASMEGFCFGTGGASGKCQDGQQRRGRNSRRSQK